MKKLLLIVLCLMLCITFVACGSSEKSADDGTKQESKSDNPIAGKTISAFKTGDVNGTEINNDIFKDHKITMINVWGTFCSPCIKEMPDLEKIYQEKKGKDFNLIGLVGDIQNGASPDKALKVIESTKVTYPNLLLDDVLITDVVSNFDFVPFTIFVDSNGKILDEVVAGSRTYEQYIEIIDNILKNN